MSSRSRVACLGATSLLLGAGLVGVTALPANATTITVTSTAGTTGAGTLHAAVVAANADPDADVIDLSALSGTITLEQHLPAITAPVTILGPGSDALTVDFSGYDAILAVNDPLAQPDFALTITGVTLTRAGDHAIFAEEVGLSLDDVQVSNPMSDGLRYVSTHGYDANVTDSSFTGTDDGIYLHVVEGSVTLHNVTSTDNEDEALDATLENSSLTITGANDFSRSGDHSIELDADTGSTAVLSGIIIEDALDDSVYISAYGGSTLDLQDITVTNSADEAFDITVGGAGTTLTGTNLAAYDSEDNGFDLVGFGGSEIDISRMIVDGNNHGFMIQATDSTIRLDQVAATNNNESGLYVGGALFGPSDLINSTVMISRSVFSGNDLGGLQVDWLANTDVTIENVTVANNHVDTEDFDFCVPGIEIFGDEGSTIDILHTTIVNNTTTSACPQLGLLGNVRVAHSIVSGADWDIAVLDDMNGDYTIEWSILGTSDPGLDAVYGVESPGAITTAADFSDALADPTNLIGVDPMLGALADNGGFSQTMLPASGSPAIDGGNPDIASAPETDQRGEARIAAGTIDIGAVEVAVEDVTPQEELPDTGAEADAALTVATLLLLLGGALLATRTVRRRTV